MFWLKLQVLYILDLPSTRRKRSVSVDVIQYDIIAFTTGCRVWNENDRKWDKTSCKVSNVNKVWTHDIVIKCSCISNSSVAKARAL